VQLVTAPESREAVQRYLGAARPPAFSRAALEALTVVAYRQPVTRAEIEAARGVNSDRAIHTLLARGLIEEVGQRQVIGRPMQYGTGFAFLEYFGLSSLADLPRIDQLEPPQADPTAIGMRTSAGQSRLLDGDEGATG
jgi:segregation and condensation protein B